MRLYLLKFGKTKLAILALIATNIMWGASGPIFKWSLQSVSPFTFAFFRFFIAALILLPFTMHKLTVKRKDFSRLISLSFFGFFIHISLFLFGLTLTSSINAPIIASSAPVFLILGGAILLKEKIKKKTIIGTAISLIGVLIIILRPILDNGIDGAIVGNILFVFSTLFFVYYTLMLKELKLHYSSSTITFWLFTIAAVLFFPFFLWEKATANILTIIDMRGLIGILFGAVFTSVLAYVFFNFAIRQIVANEVGIYLYIDPVVAVLIAMPLLGETITKTFLLGSLLVFLGIYIAERRIHYHPIHKIYKHHL